MSCNNIGMPTLKKLETVVYVYATHMYRHDIRDWCAPTLLFNLVIPFDGHVHTRNRSMCNGVQPHSDLALIFGGT